jgi:hypothetical protein
MKKKCPYCKQKVVLTPFPHDAYMGDCDCGANAEVVVDNQDLSESVSWSPPDRETDQPAATGETGT